LGACTIGWTGGVATGEYEDVSLGVHRHAGGLAEIQVRRKLKEIGNRVKRNFRCRLTLAEQGKWHGHIERESEGKAFHNDLLERFDVVIFGSSDGK
jgi:hypothetical protein